MTIDRHAFDQHFVATLLEERAVLLRKQMKNAETSAEALSGVLRSARTLAAYQAAVDPASPRLRSSLGLAAQAAAAMFQLAAAPEGTPVAVHIGDDPPRSLEATGPISTAHTGAWLTGFFAALLVDDSASLAALANTPIGILRSSTTRGDAYGELYVATLQAIATDHPLAETAHLLDAALKATAPEQLQIAPRALVLQVVVPQLDVLFRILTRDRPALDTSLRRGLDLHARYWTEELNKPEAVEALLPLELVALARLGVKRGLSTQVRSSYLPEQLLEDPGRSESS